MWVILRRSVCFSAIRGLTRSELAWGQGGDPCESARFCAIRGPAFNQHDLRHRRVTTWLAEGKNPVHVKEAMGHADLATTMGYTHLAKEHLRSLVEQEPKREELRDLA